MADIQIVKRDGRRQSYDNKKVAAVVARAAAGFELDVSPLLDAVNNYVKEGIGSQEVMNFLILTALNLTSVENPDWKNVAGRLKLFDLYKKTALARNCNHCYDRLYDYPVFCSRCGRTVVMTGNGRRNIRRKNWPKPGPLLNRRMIWCMIMPASIC